MSNKRLVILQNAERTAKAQYNLSVPAHVSSKNYKKGYYDALQDLMNFLESDDDPNCFRVLNGVNHEF